MASASFSRGLQQLKFNTELVGERYNEVLDEHVNKAADEATLYMRANAPWKDNDGNRDDRLPGAARAGLHAHADDGHLVHDHAHKEITLSHGVDYGIWLETKYSGRDEIIMPSVKHIGERLMAGLEGSLYEATQGHA